MEYRDELRLWVSMFEWHGIMGRWYGSRNGNELCEEQCVIWAGGVEYI